MEIVLSLSSPTTPLDAGIAQIVANEAIRHFRALTPGGAQAVELRDIADITSVTLTDFAAEDGGTQTIDFTWTDLTDTAIIGYVIQTFDDADFSLDTLTFVAPGEEAVTVTPSGGAGTYSSYIYAITAFAEAGSAEAVVVA